VTEFAVFAGVKGYLLKTTTAKTLLSLLFGIERGEAAIHGSLMNLPR